MRDERCVCVLIFDCFRCPIDRFDPFKCIEKSKMRASLIKRRGLISTLNIDLKWLIACNLHEMKCLINFFCSASNLITSNNRQFGIVQTVKLMSYCSIRCAYGVVYMKYVTDAMTNTTAFFMGFFLFEIV